ncbi:MAG: WXG100 family type VII secretion target [Planctomycetota bacterium]|nr:WXG100 family type VII secretion target [Planctomycetota bacterium]
MAQAIVDPAELRQFAQTLKQFNTELRERTAALTVQLGQLSTSWRDQENRKFTQEFEQHMQFMSRFNELIEQHIPYLFRKAEAIEEYLQQR